ncbi:MAG: hypothetical protein JMDDDDMK_01792 [Acidobacteria bacterium]|nr:hypothetical protein [Acidobacteriota bacterium]
MAKSKYDRNVDKGAAQQRNAGQESSGGYNKPGTFGDETVGTGQQSSGNPKYQGGGSHKHNRKGSKGSSGRNNPTGGSNG